MDARDAELRDNVAASLASNNVVAPTVKYIVITDATLDNVKLEGITVELGSGEPKTSETKFSGEIVKKHVTVNFDGVIGEQMRTLLFKTANALWIRYQDKMRRDSTASDFKRLPFELVIKASDLLEKQKRTRKVKEMTVEELKAEAVKRLSKDELLAMIAEMEKGAV